MSTHFTLSLLHQPRITSHLLMSTMGGPTFTSPCSMSHMWLFFIRRARLTHCQLTCSTHKQPSTIKVVMFPTLPNSPLLYLDMGHIRWYHRCFPSRFTTPPFIPSYSICFLHWCSTCLAYSFNPYEHWPIWHYNLAYIFFLSLLGVCFFLPEVARKVNKRLVPTSIGT